MTSALHANPRCFQLWVLYIDKGLGAQDQVEDTNLSFVEQTLLLYTNESIPVGGF